jgi:hypothetical protein
MPDDRRAEALRLAEELLTDIECSRLPPTDLAKRASRLARLLDDTEAMTWLRFEVAGYTPGNLGQMSTEEVAAATKSKRIQTIDKDTGLPTFTVMSLGALQARLDAISTALAADSGGPSSSEWALAVENARTARRNDLINAASTMRAIIDGVVGAIHEYAADRYQELRFGSTVEGAFQRLRDEVDSAIGSLVPTALPRLNAALENAVSDSPEHWANAAGTCRRLLKEVADALRPPGPDVDGRKMGEDNYVNRLVDWISRQERSATAREMAISDLEYLGQRLDSVAGAGHKGIHAEVTRHDASRFLVGTYLLLGDIVHLAGKEQHLPDALPISTALAPEAPSDDLTSIAVSRPEVVDEASTER